MNGKKNTDTKSRLIPELIFSADKEMGWMIKFGEKTVCGKFDNQDQYEHALKWFSDTFNSTTLKNEKIQW